MTEERLRMFEEMASSESAELCAEIRRLRSALESIRLRFDEEDTGDGFGRGGSMSWAMANDARKALGLLQEAEA